MLLLLIAISTIAPTFITVPVKAQDQPRFWALLVCGAPAAEQDAYYMYYILTHRYTFDDDNIYYVCIDRKEGDHYGPPGIIDKEIMSENDVPSAITGWLKNKSDANDTVFMYFVGHGGGYNSGLKAVEGGFYDEVGDEGNETRESTIGCDLNGDGNITDDWVGIDENIIINGPEPDHGPTIRPEYNYTDDELAEDLNELNYKTLIFARLGCFSGGIIDDISASGRIIMTSTNETSHSAKDRDGDGFSEWTESFQNALYGEKMEWDWVNKTLIHTGVEVDADENDDG